MTIQVGAAAGRKPRDARMGSMRSPTSAVSAPGDVVAALDALREARDRTLSLVEPVRDDDLVRVHSPLMSPLVWDLGHIAAFEDLWMSHRYGGRPLLRADLVDVYDAMETPRARRGDLPFLGPDAAREYMDEVRARTVDVLHDLGTGDGTLVELVIRHEHQHNETMLQTLELAHLDGYELLQPGFSDTAMSVSALTGLEMVEIPAGPCTVGAHAEGFAYDNERPLHRTDIRGYLIGHTPITNATYLTFVEGGGYERREWWSDEGWAWKEQYDITRPAGWTEDGGAQWRLTGLEPLHPNHPVVHVSWFEADAFARAHGARLPSEAEWEKAATWDQELDEARPAPWGSVPAVPGVHANLDQLGCGTSPVDGHPEGRSPAGCLGMVGNVWEWTAGRFDAYPGFAAYPYREYSEPFFGGDYRVLRGGSWATRARVATATFRNWDHPQRRQIFSGFRIARDS
jgi:gamma-glutamyl hercynylcysteine S-oxide synthase